MCTIPLLMHSGVLIEKLKLFSGSECSLTAAVTVQEVVLTSDHKNTKPRNCCPPQTSSILKKTSHIYFVSPGESGSATCEINLNYSKMGKMHFSSHSPPQNSDILKCVTFNSLLLFSHSELHLNV